MTLRSRLKSIILSPACFGPSPTRDDPGPASSRRTAPAAPPGLQPRGPQPGAPAQPARRHWYSLKRSQIQAPLPSARQPASMSVQTQPAIHQPAIHTWAALDRIAEEDARALRRARTGTTLADLLSQPERPSERHLPYGGPGPVDTQASSEHLVSASQDLTQHGPPDRSLLRSLTLQPWVTPPPPEATPPAAVPEVPPQRTRRRWPKMPFLHRHSRPADTASASRPAQEPALARTQPPPREEEHPAADSPVAPRQPVGPIFDESRPSSLRIDPDLQIGPLRIEPVQIEPLRVEPPHIYPPRREPAGLGQGQPLGWLPPWDSMAAQDSFDRRTSDSQDVTRHGPVNRRFWNSLMPPGSDLQPIEVPLPPPEDLPAAVPETRRSAGAEARRLGGVLASHLARQVVATGTSTLVREGVNIGIAMGLRRQPGLAAGLTLSMTLLNLMAQLQREKRVLRAPDEAARGFHSLSQAQWQATSPELQAALREEQQASSRRVTRLHLLSNLITTSVAMVGAARPGGRIGAMAAPMPSVLLGQMARQWAYVGLRDGLQATFTSVQTSRPSPLPNIEQRRMRIAGATYGGAQAMLGYAQEALMPRVLKALSQGSSTIRASGGLLSSVGTGLGQWARTIAAVAGVRASMNVMGETLDDAQLTHHDAAAAGGEQVPGLDVRALDPARRDYGRLLDHAMVRVFANDVVGGVMNAVGLATGQLPARFADVASFVGNFGVGCIIHMTYPMVGNNFAAAGLVREAVRPPQPADPESGHSAFRRSASTASQASTTTSYYRPEA